MPDPGGVRTAAAFIDELRRLRARSGLSYRELERRARLGGDVLPASTLAGALNRSSLPHPDLVIAFVRACGGSPGEVDNWMAARRVVAETEVSGHRPQAVVPAKTGRLTPCLLPPERPGFVGRLTETTAVRAALTGDAVGPATVLVTGPAGVGKTAFAVRAAHAIAAEFPDGQLFMDMRGAGPDPAEPAVVLAAFLRALGVSGGAVPSEIIDRVHLYRTLVARRRLLVVLDDAADTRQVRDLLPNGARCAAIVSSRTTLSDLDGSRVPLDVLPTGEAVEMLREMIGVARTDAEPDMAEAIIDQCGRLPLAVWVIGARLAARPHLSLAGISQVLTDVHRKLDTLIVGDIAVRASLDLTYRSLNPAARRLWRLLTLMPIDFPVWAVSALLDTGLAEAEQVLDDLVDVHLVECFTTAGQSRFRLHDLVHAFAGERSVIEDEQPSRDAAMRRVLGAALQLTETGEARLSADFQEVNNDQVGHWTLPCDEADHVLSDPLAWFDAEHIFLILLTERALRSATDAAASLATSLTTFFQIRNLFDDWLRIQRRALRAVQLSGNLHLAGKLHRALGELATIQDHYPSAVNHFEHAMRLGTVPAGEQGASAMAGLAYVYRLMGRYQSAVATFRQAAQLAAAAGNLNCLVYANNGIGVVALEQGHTMTAREYFDEGLRLSLLASYLPGQAQALRCLGQSYRNASEYEFAADCFRQAERISLGLGDRLAATHASCWLGDVMVRSGQRCEGHRLLARSMWIYREFGNAWGEAATRYCLAEAHLANGGSSNAIRHATGAVKIWSKIGALHWQEIGLETLARSHRHAGDEHAAQHALAEAQRARSRLEYQAVQFETFGTGNNSANCGPFAGPLSSAS